MNGLGALTSLASLAGPLTAIQWQKKWPRQRKARRAWCMALILPLIWLSSIVASNEIVAIETGKPLTLAAAQPFLGDFDKMIERRQVRVLIPYSKTYFFLDGGTARGIAVEALRDFEKQLNEKINNKFEHIFVFAIPTPRDKLIGELVAGRGDLVVANLTVTEEREGEVAFSDPVLTGVKELVVTSSGSADFATIDDLSGQAVTVRRSSSYFESLEKANGALAAKGLAPIKIIEADAQLEDEDLLEMVQAELVAATVIDSHKFELWRKVHTKLKAHEAVTLRDDGRIAWAFRKESPQLRDVVNRYIAQTKKGTERGNIIYAEYIKSDKWLKRAGSPENRTRLQGLLSLFRKYGEMYSIDPFLIAAVAFQESRFDQRLVMKSGATGIMQMMPSTARDPNVNLPDLHNLETNVHAFARYFRFLREQYVNQPSLSEFDRMMLLLASYNAGPSRVKKLREASANPNVWHESVEWAVWEEVGLETVQYVRNVHRYYITFSEMHAAIVARSKLMQEAQSK